MEGRGPPEGFSESLGPSQHCRVTGRLGKNTLSSPEGGLWPGDVWAGFLEPQAAPVQPGAKRSPSDVCVRS